VTGRKLQAIPRTVQVLDEKHLVDAVDFHICGLSTTHFHIETTGRCQSLSREIFHSLELISSMALADLDEMNSSFYLKNFSKKKTLPP
jgi:hypothetical protein